ncbi:MAG: protein tyrosine phosphatase family protein [Cyanobacteria bacterium J06626_14]
MLADIYNYQPISETLATAGQPTEDQFAVIRDAGFEVVINLAPTTPGKTLPNEKSVVEGLGMMYVLIPVAWQAPAVGDFTQFQAVLAEQTDSRIFIHCVANMRVSAFVYLHQRLQGISHAEAAQPLHAIWTPNEIWQAFIQRMIEQSLKDRGTICSVSPLLR